MNISEPFQDFVDSSKKLGNRYVYTLRLKSHTVQSDKAPSLRIKSFAIINLRGVWCLIRGNDNVIAS